MRISTSMTFDNFIFHQQRLSAALLGDQLKISSGRGVNVPSDSPLQATRLLKLSQIEEDQNQILENINFATDFLDAADVAMSEVSELLIRVQGLTSGAVSNLSLPEEREAASLEIDSIINQLTLIAQRQHMGMYIFGGKDVLNPPVVDGLGGIHYVGNTGQLRTRLAENVDEEFTLTADDAFGMLSQRVVGNVDLSPAVTRATRLDELDGADNLGIRLGSLTITETGPAGTFTVDLTQSTSVGQIVDLINAAAVAAGSGLQAQLSDDGSGLTIVPDDELVISSSENGSIASDLGILTNTPTSDPIVGRALNRRLTMSTPIEDLLAGSGIDFTNNNFVIRNGTLSVTIDLTFAQTLQDVINTINNAQVGARASINDRGDGIDIVNEVSGTELSIEENGGNAATVLGVRSLSGDSRLADLNFGKGVRHKEGQDDIEIIARDGNAIRINLDGLDTVQDVINLINTTATDAGVGIVASLASAGNGIRIADETGGAGSLQLNRVDFSFALDDLGLNVEVAADALEVTGRDVHTVRVDGIFGALLNLREALTEGNELGINDAAAALDEAFIEMTRVQGRIGAEVRALEARADQTQEAVDATGTLLSQVRDLDYAEAITRFQQTQTALQASLLASSQSLNLSLLNFLQ